MATAAAGEEGRRRSSRGSSRKRGEGQSLPERTGSTDSMKDSHTSNHLERLSSFERAGSFQSAGSWTRQSAVSESLGDFRESHNDRVWSADERESFVPPAVGSEIRICKVWQKTGKCPFGRL
eukprot:759067-Hanusia_phi.AAC.10